VKAERFEGYVQVLILITVAGMAGAGSFTHVHDWTMSVVPEHTGSWLGWVNAVITELVPAAAGIEIRRRKRQHRRVTYPMAILATDVLISIGVQLSDARHDFGGSLAFALPALAFLALTKLVLSRARTTAQKEDQQCAPPAPPASASNAPTPSPAAALAPIAAATATGTTFPTVLKPEASSSSPAASARTAFPSSGSIDPVPIGQLLISARMAAFSHQQQAGTSITPDELASRMSIPPALAESLLDHLNDGGTPPPVTAINGTAWNGSRP
jgi:hypothetical protein